MEFTQLLLLAFLGPFLGALVTFYTGFGLNTILVPVFMIYFDAPIAVLMAGIVHLFNNILKVTLTVKSVDWHLFRNFGIPALLFAFIGAYLLNTLKDSIGNQLKPLFGFLFMVFAILELFNWKLPLQGSWAMRIGGSLSGFFGGFSGHQGALRALFLSRYKLEPLVFVATTALISLFVDLTRVGVYFSGNWFNNFYPTYLYFIGVPAALLGTLIGRRYIQKMNNDKMSTTVGIGLFMMGLALMLGWI